VAGILAQIAKPALAVEIGVGIAGIARLQVGLGVTAIAWCAFRYRAWRP
jgi:hypothetical protein